MPIPEQDALRAIAVAKANPNDPAVIAKAQALTRAYQAQQEAAGLSMFPEQERRRDEQASTLRSFFTEPNHGLDEDTLVSLNENFRESPDEKFKLFNRKWFEAAGVPRERVEREADELMKIYSEREWGTPSTTHKHFFDRIARDYQTREEVANAAKETSLQNLGVLRSELAFKERFRENSSYVGREQKWDKEFQSLKDRFDQKLAPHRSTVKLLSAALMTKEGVDVEDPTTMDEALAQRREIDNAASYRELAEMVMMVPAEDRKLVIAAAVAASANDEAGRKSVMEGLVEKFDRGLRGGMDSVVSIGERSQAIAVERAIAEGVEVPAEKAGTPEEYMEAVLQRVAGGDAYEVRAGVMKAVAGADFDKPSDEVKDQALAMIRENKDAIDLRDELRLAAENDIDPVTSEFLPVRGLYAAAESVPYMMTSMARGGWAINAMALAGDSYRSLRAANPTMTAEQAQTLSMLSGPFQAFIEKGQTTLALGQFKAVNRFFNQITRTKGAVASRFLTRTAATAGLEMVQENVQDLTPFVLQGLLSALDEDMPEVPWGPVYGDLLKQQPELFFAVLPLAVIGGGAGTYSDFKGGAELLTSYDLLRATGLSEAAASEVRALASQGNVEGAQTLLRQEFKTLGQDQKSVQEARAEAIPRMIAEREAMQQALNEAGELDILPAILREGEKYTLRYSGGEAVQYDSHAEAFARFEAVASSAVAALHEDMITAARMTTSQIERGREVKFIVSPLRPTTEDMEAQGVATGEDMAQRMEISEADKALTPKTEERKAKAMAGMVANSPEARTAVNYILGSATTSEAAPDSFGDRVVRNTVRLYQGATPFTLFEETAEGDAKFMIRELGLRRWMIGALRQWEATSGDTLFRASIKEESQIKDQDIVEAYSKMVQGYLAGRSKSGDQGRVFSSRFRKSIADALRGDFGAVLTGYASLFEAVYRRAAMIEKARRDKTFDGDLETFLAKSTGMSEQRLFERDVQREGSAIAQDLSGNPDFSSGEGTARGSQRRGGVDTTFSLLPDASNLDTEFARMFSPFQRSPELRAKLGLAMRQKTIGVETKLLPIIRSFYRTKNAIQREASVREGFEYDRLLRETFGADTPAKQDALPAVDRQAARSDARRIADQWMEGEMKKKEVAPRQTLIGFLRTLDAITRALPAEVRGKIGGSVALAKLVTPAAMLDEIESRVERIDVELERYLKKEADDRRKALFETAKPKREAGKKPKGKAGADIHDLFDRLKEALLWDGDQAEAWATMLEDRIGKGELSAEAEAHAKIEANLVRLFSDWKNADAARRTAAVDAGEEVWRVGYLAEKERIAKERERRAEIRAEIIAGTGKLGSRPERVVKAQQDAGLSGQWKEWFLSLFNFEQVAGFAMGAESKWTLWFSDAQREAEAKKLDEVQAVLDGLDELFRELGGSRLGGEKLQWKLSQPSFETKAGGKMSELEGVTALLMWRQEDGKRHMRGKRDENGKIVSAWSYDETFIAEIEKNLSTEALAVMDYLTDQYAGEYETLNPIFRELNGINLPRNDKYSPLTVKPQQAPGGQTTDPVTGSTMSNGSMTPGSLRTRAQVVAEPDFRNAVEVFVGHKKQLAHWKAYAVFSRDAQAILGNREVGNAIEAASGQEAAKVLRSWLDLFAQGGVRDAGSHLALTKALGAAMGRASAVQLVGRLGTLAIQTTQLGAAAAKMPVRDYIVRLSKLLTGNLGWGEALNSPYIQRRLAQMPASVQVAMEGLRAGKPNMIKHAAQRVGQLLSGTDALFTAGTYAMVFDYQLTKATRAGVDPVTAAEIARNEAERIVDEIAQPTRQGTRSLFEATATNPLGRVAWAFASEARKNMALVAYTGGKRPSGDLARALLYVIVFNGVLSALIRTAWRDLRDDEEGEDEWGMRRILLSVASEPLYGFPGFGEIAQDAIFAAAGEWKPSGSILDAPVKAPAAIVRAPENFGMVLEGDFEQPLRDLETMLMAGGLFNDTIAGLASFSHVLRDAESLIRNFIPNTP